MKNTLLILVLGLFTTGYLEEGWSNPIGPIGGMDCEDGFCDKGGVSNHWLYLQ
tara:strand:- start:297 stop:455 length:159 start_codon:yes stop_codon:yes gene_type:complete